MIIETSANCFYSVDPAELADEPELSHVWLGREVKRTKAGWVFKPKRPLLVRKDGTRVVEA